MGSTQLPELQPCKPRARACTPNNNNSNNNNTNNSNNNNSNNNSNNSSNNNNNIREYNILQQNFTTSR